MAQDGTQAARSLAQIPMTGEAGTVTQGTNAIDLTNIPDDVLIKKCGSVLPSSRFRLECVQGDRVEERLAARRVVATPTTRPSPNPSLGSLNSLPLEVLDDILGKLTMVDLLQLAAVNLLASQVVMEFSPFKALMKHAQLALWVLARTKLLRQHSVSMLRATLANSRCVSCGEFAALMFLPLCQRACLPCLSRDKALTAISLYSALFFFNLEEKDIAELNVFNRLSYGGKDQSYDTDAVYVQHSIMRSHAPLVSLAQVWELGCRRNGSLAAVHINVANKLLLHGEISEGEYEMFITLVGVKSVLHNLDRALVDRLRASRELSHYRDLRLVHPGWASVRMKVVPLGSDVPEATISCAGCQLAIRDDAGRRLYRFRHTRAAGRSAGQVYTRAKFIEHVRKCGACVTFADHLDLVPDGLASDNLQTKWTALRTHKNCNDPHCWHWGPLDEPLGPEAAKEVESLLRIVD